jgi:hypothetical protein
MGTPQMRAIESKPDVTSRVPSSFVLFNVVPSV